MRILVAGYYGRRNLGDEAFKQAIPLVVGEKHVYEFTCVDDLNRYDCPETDPNELFDIVLLGAGDVVNAYFLNKFQPFFKRYTTGPIILFGAGITWPTCVEMGHLDQFDHVFLRNTTDLRKAEARLGTDWVHFVPDVVFSLLPCCKDCGGDTLTASTAAGDDNIEEVGGKEELSALVERPTAGIFLIQSIDQENPKDPATQDHVLNQLAECIRYVAETHDVTLVRFNSSGTRDGDDVYISRHIQDMVFRVATDTKINVQVDEAEYSTPQAMLERMDSFSVHVCMRFHSHVFSVIQGVPFVSLVLTRKVDMLVTELGLMEECGVRLEYDPETLKPTNVPVDQFKERVDHVVEHREELKEKLQGLYLHRHSLLKSRVYGKLIENATSRPDRRLEHVSQEHQTLVDDLVEQGSRWWRHRLRFDLNTVQVEDGQRDLGTNITNTTVQLTPLTNVKRVRHHVQTVCERLCYNITKQIHAPYLFGFVENMMKDPLRIREYLQWIVEDYTKQTQQKDNDRKFNLNYIRQHDFNGSHRSGWSFAMNHLQPLQSDKGVLLDTCMDRTFHWGCDALTKAGVLPYTQSWCGFIHHTPLEAYTDYNTTSMLRNPLFQESLLTCRGIYVLSESLKEWLQTELKSLDFLISQDIPIQVVQHPTEIPRKKHRFSLRKFYRNKDRKMVHIGAWLRNTFALYEIGLLDVSEQEVLRAQYQCHLNQQPGGKKTSFRRCGRQQRGLWNDSVGYMIHVFKNGKVKTKKLRRCMLHGKNMGLYMPPDSLHIGSGSQNCEEHDDNQEEANGGGPCRHGCTNGMDDRYRSLLSSDPKPTLSRSDTLTDSTQITEKRVACGRERNNGARRAANWFESKCENKWVLELRKHVNEKVLQVVDVIDGLDNDEYDRLLQENIVFLNLYDASACNTLLECVVRNTPILINPLPAVVEVLGKDYPLYYYSYAEALAKSRRYSLIREAHYYLCQLEKQRYKVDFFVNQIRNGDIYKSL